MTRFNNLWYAFVAFLFLLVTVRGYGQNSLNSGDFNVGSWGSGQAMSSSISGTFLLTKNVTTSGDKYFRFYGDGSPCGEYQPASNGDAFSSGVTKTTGSSCGSANAWKINVPNSTDYVVFKTDAANNGGNAVGFVLSGAPIDINTVSRDIATPCNSQSVIITTTLSGTLPTGQKVYIRYHTGAGFGSATITEMTGSGTTYTTTIPNQLSGTTVAYYTFTSGSSAPSNSESDLRTISWNSGSVNGGSNYSYTVAAATPATPGTITGTTPQCPSLTSQGYSITAVPNASTYTWTIPTGWSITAGTGTNSITVTTGTAGQNGNITVTAGNSCGTSSAQTLAVTVVATPATPGTISGTTPQCPSLTSQAYSIAAVTNASTYTWAVPTGWSITAGTGTNSIMVTTGTAGQNGNITVTAGNSCGTSSVQTLAVTVSAATPSTPGTITGTTPQCPSLTSQGYSITAVSGATTYTWTIPTGWTVTAGAGTNSIAVTTGTTGQNGNITVTAGNSCGTSSAQTLAVTVVATPATPGTITGTTPQCPSLTSQAYSIAAVTNASTYTWAVPTGWSITAGTGTNSITVTTGTAGQNGNITVTAGNSCGTSSAQTLAVTVINTTATIGSPSSSSVSATTATLGGNISNIGCSSVTECGIYYSTSSGFADGAGTKVSTTGSFGTGTFTQSVTGLSAVTTYYYKAFATNSGGTVYTTQGTFTTANPIYSGKAYFNLNGGTTFFAGCSVNNTCDPGGNGSYDLLSNIVDVGSLSQGQDFKLGGNIIQYGTVFTNATMYYRVYKSGNTAPAYSTITLANNGAPGNGCNATDTKWEKATTSFTPIIAGYNSAGVYEGTGTFVVDIYYTVNSGAISWYKTGTTPFTANFTVTPDIFSAKVAFKIDSNTTTWHSANHDETCDPGNTGGNFDTKDFGVVVRTGSTALAIGGNLVANTAVTNANLRYRIYLTSTDPSGVAYQTVSLSSTGTTACSGKTKKEENTPQTITASSFATDGEYYIEAYFEATDVTGVVYYNNSNSNFKARISVYLATPTAERDANDGNYDPTATNTSGIYESYMGIIVLDENDVPIPTLNRVFDMDGALSSSNGTNFDFGIQNPGLSFNVGTEAKIFTKGTHKDCGCSSWYYVYKDTDSNPVESDFPLPVAGSLFTNQINGKFTLLNSSENLGANTPFSRSTSALLDNSTSTTSYNTSLGPIGANTIKYKDYTDPVTGTVTSINTPVNAVGCPTCSGKFRVAVALLAWVSTTGNCADVTSLIYHRDINKDKITDAGVVLNPNHPNVPLSNAGSPSKNTLTGTNLFYISKVEIGASNGMKTWNGSWSPTGTPTSKNNVTISSAYSTTTNGSFTCNDMTVNTGVIVTINDGNYIEALNTVTTEGTGKIIVENTGNFVQRCNEKLALAKIEHTKSTRAMKFLDYIYWGAPVLENVISQFPADLDWKFRWQSGPGGGWQGLTSTTPGEGFITRVRTTSSIPVTFTGTATNGIITVPVQRENADPTNYNNFALISNPYPCAIDAKTFLLNPNNTTIESTLYFWTSITAISSATSGSWQYNYNPDDYATWNFTGGTITASKAITAAAGILVPSGKIASGQGFFVEVKNIGSSTVTFDNDMRLTANVNTQFYKTKPTKQKTQSNTNTDKKTGLSTLEEGRIWLNVSNEGHFRQLLLGYMNGATNDYDERFDGLSYTDSPIAIYTILDDKDLVIQGRQLPFDENEIVPIGYETTIAGDFYINIDDADGFLTNQNVYLKDNLLGIEHDLKQNPYLFTTAIGKFKDRFELKYTSKTLGVNKTNQKLESVFVSTSGNQIKINSTSENISSVIVYDITGKKILSKTNIDKNELILDKLTKQNSVLLVKIKLANGQESTQKVIF